MVSGCYFRHVWGIEKNRAGYCPYLLSVGKSYASKVDDEKWLLSSGTDTDLNKNPATCIIELVFPQWKNGENER